MQKNKSKTRVRDGKNPIPYQQRKATKKARQKIREKGYLQVDEMKLKHSVVFHAKTNEVIGLADDMVDLESVMGRILFEEGDKLEAVVYVSQWQYVMFGQNGLEI